MNLTHFRYYRKEEILQQTSLRKFETRMGEVVQTMQPGLTLQKELDQSTASYVLIGIPEDIGVQANMGAPGGGQMWYAFLHAFLNSQSNDFLEGEEVLVLGYFDFSVVRELVDKMALDNEEKVGAYRHAVNTIDEEVEGLVKAIVQSGKIPLVISGGHNNAYPCLKGAAKALAQSGLAPLPQINAINLCAHTGYQPAEGRHSGNAFRYAEEDGYLEKYCMLGIEETFLQQNVWMDIVNNPFLDCITYEDIFVRNKRTFAQAVEHAIGFTDDTYTGIELDMDVIQGNHSQLGNSGIGAMAARQYVTLAGNNAKVAYLHIAAGAGCDTASEDYQAFGTLASLLVTDFIKAVEEVRD